METLVIEDIPTVSDEYTDMVWMPAFLGDCAPGMTIQYLRLEISLSRYSTKTTWIGEIGTITSFQVITGLGSSYVEMRLDSGQIRKCSPNQDVWVATHKAYKTLATIERCK